LLPSLAPSRGLTLVHAVQRPMKPGFSDGDVVLTDRQEGETSHIVTADLSYDGYSAGRVDLIASWDEHVDVPNSADPLKDPSLPKNAVHHSGAIVTLTPNTTDTQSQQVVRQLFGDTKRRDITFTEVATTRFREYFPPSITSDSANITNRA